MTFGLRFIIQTVNEPAMNRPVRTRMRGGVGRAGEKPALTRLYAGEMTAFYAAGLILGLFSSQRILELFILSMALKNRVG